MKNKTPLEAWEQEQIFKWKRSNQIRIPELQLMYSSLSGAKLSPRVRAAMKRQGLEAGFPDINLDVPGQGYHGLRIELKRRKGGRVSSEQKIIHRLMRDRGYRVDVCRGWNEAIDVTKDYISEKGKRRKTMINVMYDLFDPELKRVGKKWYVPWRGIVVLVPVDKCVVHGKAGKLEIPIQLLDEGGE